MRLFYYFLAFFFPASILLMKDNPGGFFVAMVLQASLIGWIPASVWALNILKEDETFQKSKKKKKKQQKAEQQSTQAKE